MSFMKCDGKLIKAELKKKRIKLIDISAELGKSHSYLSNCLAQDYLDDKALRFICAKYGINYYSVRRGWATEKVTKYTKTVNKPEIKTIPSESEVKVVENGALTTEDKIDLILRNMQELNKMMADIIRRDSKC